MNSSNKKIKLMFIIDFIYSTSGGTESQLIKIINKLPKDKYDLHLLSLRNTKWLVDHKYELPCNIKSYNITKLKNPIHLVTFILIVKYIKKVSPHIVLTLFPLSNIMGVIAAKLASVKVIFSTRRDYGLWLNKWSIHLIRIANRFVNNIVANSESVRTLTIAEEKVADSKVKVIYNGMDTYLFQQPLVKSKKLKKSLGIAPHINIIGIVGNLRPMKRHTIFLKAANQVLKESDDINFVIVGDGPLRQDIVDEIAMLGIEKQVHLVGRQDDVFPFLSIFDLAVNCSSNEGLSNAIIEYMAYGIPCIVAKAGGNPELIVNGVNGYTFELDNIEELAKLISSLLEDKKKQIIFAQKSKKIALARFSVDRMVSDYNNLFIQSLVF